MTHLLLIMIYLAFISLGLPDALLGSAWPTMQPEFGVPLSFAGIVSMIIAVGTIVSSLLSDRLTRKWGTGVVTACSVGLTAIALIGFSVSRSFLLLCLWAVPYGLGAGSVDASLNNYVALHYKSRHMSWLHCMWGIGATLGPYVMGYVLTGGGIWNDGYRYIGLAQVLLTAVLLCSLPMWKKSERGTGEAETHLTDDLVGTTVRKPHETIRGFAYSGGKRSDVVLFLLLYRGTNSKFVGEQLFDDISRCGTADSCAFCRIVFYRYYRGTRVVWIFDIQIARCPNGTVGAGCDCSWYCGTAVAGSAHCFTCRFDYHWFWLRTDLSVSDSLNTFSFRRFPVTGGDRCTDGKRICGDLSDAAVVWIDCQSHHGCAIADLSVACTGCHGVDACAFDETGAGTR